jgi:hypothetical protein
MGPKTAAATMATMYARRMIVPIVLTADSVRECDADYVGRDLGPGNGLLVGSCVGGAQLRWPSLR